MTIKFKKLSEKAVTPEYNEDGTISLFSVEVKQAFDITNRPVMVYHTGLTLDIPTGYNLLAFAPKRHVTTSLTFSRDNFISEYTMQNLTDDKEIVVEYKIDTNTVPAAYSIGEEILRLYLVKKEDTAIEVEEFQQATVAQDEEVIAVETEEVLA